MFAHHIVQKTKFENDTNLSVTDLVLKRGNVCIFQTVKLNLYNRHGPQPPTV